MQIHSEPTSIEGYIPFSKKKYISFDMEQFRSDVSSNLKILMEIDHSPNELEDPSFCINFSFGDDACSLLAIARIDKCCIFSSNSRTHECKIFSCKKKSLIVDVLSTIDKYFDIGFIPTSYYLNL